MSSTSTSAAAVVAALLSSAAAYVLGAVVLPVLSAFVRRSRALKRLGLPTPRALNLSERVFGTMARFDPTKPANYCRTVMQEWARECGEPPLLVARGLDRHLVVVLDPGAATSVSILGSLSLSFGLSFFLFLSIFGFLFSFCRSLFLLTLLSLSPPSLPPPLSPRLTLALFAVRPPKKKKTGPLPR